MQTSLDSLVTSLCADYARRSELIHKGDLSRRVETELRYINAKIVDASLEVCQDFELEDFIIEIGGSIGYAKSSLYHMSESTYKRKKRDIKENIARKLFLIQ